MTRAFTLDRITATKALIIAYEDAILAVTTGGVQSYELDTGQSRQRVTKLDINQMQKVIDSLMNRLVTLEARLTGNGTTVVRAAW